MKSLVSTLTLLLAFGVFLQQPAPAAAPAKVIFFLVDAKTPYPETATSKPALGSRIAKPEPTTPSGTPQAVFSQGIPKEGLEPSLDCSNWILNPARLPIPPLRLS